MMQHAFAIVLSSSQRPMEEKQMPDLKSDHTLLVPQQQANSLTNFQAACRKEDASGADTSPFCLLFFLHPDGCFFQLLRNHVTEPDNGLITIQ